MNCCETCWKASTNWIWSQNMMTVTVGPVLLYYSSGQTLPCGRLLAWRWLWGSCWSRNSTVISCAPCVLCQIPRVCLPFVSDLLFPGLGPFPFCLCKLCTSAERTQGCMQLMLALNLLGVSTPCPGFQSHLGLQNMRIHCGTAWRYLQHWLLSLKMHEWVEESTGWMDCTCLKVHGG